jgi:predicted pyridoxine 5'-phosphate oxidase superfamily flavin-nucleotide-binding protein
MLDAITPEISAFITDQHLFFVATAASGPEGRVNLSPKGLDTFAVIDDHTVAWLDLTGSGIETVAHLRDNGRITLMFCAFEGKPNIVRLYGRGEAIAVDDPAAAPILARFPSRPGARTVVRVAVEHVSTSCGYAVPLMTFVGERPTLDEWAERRGPDGIASYWTEKNATSIDGLPGLPGLPAR